MNGNGLSPGINKKRKQKNDYIYLQELNLLFHNACIENIV